MHMSTRTISNVDMYTDDSTISACGKNVQEIELKLNNDLQEISNWCDKNRMVVNVEKTNIVIVTTRQKWQHLDKTDINICIKGDKLQVVENVRKLSTRRPTSCWKCPHFEGPYTKYTQHDCRKTRIYVQDKTIPSIQSKENVLQQLHSTPHRLLQHTLGQCNIKWHL